MKRKREEIRQYGQLSLPSALLSRSREMTDNGARSSKEIVRESSKRSISLSEFLTRKVDKPTSRTVQEKHNSFSSISTWFAHGSRGMERDGSKTSAIVNESVFKHFSHAEEEKIGRKAGVEGEVQALEFAKSKEDATENADKFSVSICAGLPRSSRHLVVLGDDPKPKQLRSIQSISSRKPDKMFNHYANGRGWWDSDREGLDHKELGCKEEWENVGSTTIGGLEWN